MAVTATTILAGVLGGVFALLGVLLKSVLDHRQETRSDRRQAVTWWREGLAHWERAALDARSAGLPPPDVRRDAWFGSFALQAADGVLAKIDDASEGEFGSRQPHYETGNDVPREEVAAEIQKEIGRDSQGLGDPLDRPLAGAISDHRSRRLPRSPLRSSGRLGIQTVRPGHPGHPAVRVGSPVVDPGPCGLSLQIPGSEPLGRIFWEDRKVPAYTAGYRVLETAYREAYEARGVEGVFQQFGASGLYKLFNEWNTGGYWLSPKSNPNSTFRISAAHWVGDGRRIRDIWVSVSLNNSRGGGGTELRDEEAHRFAGALRSARENPIFDEHVGQVRIMRGVDDYDYLPYRPPIPEGIQILVPWRDVALAVVLDEDEVQEVERALPGAFAEVEFYRTQKKLAESLLDKG